MNAGDQRAAFFASETKNLEFSAQTSICDADLLEVEELAAIVGLIVEAEASSAVSASEFSLKMTVSLICARFFALCLFADSYEKPKAVLAVEAS